MASVIVVSAPCRVGQTLPAVHYDATSVLGKIDKKTATPVQVRLTTSNLAADFLFVDDERRSIIQSMIVGDETRFFITGSTSSLRNADRRRALARAQVLFAQARDCLSSEVPKSVAASLAVLSEWIDSELIRLSAKPTPQLIGGDNAARNDERTQR